MRVNIELGAGEEHGVVCQRNNIEFISFRARSATLHIASSYIGTYDASFLTQKWYRTKTLLSPTPLAGVLHPYHVQGTSTHRWIEQ